MSKDLFTHLIIKSFSEELTAEERQMLDAWLAEEAAHRELFDKLKLSWEKADEYKSEFQVDLDKGWQAIQTKIGEGGQATKQPAKVIPFWRQPAMRIAASLILIVAMAWLTVTYFTSGPNEVKYSAVATGEMETREVSLPDGSTVWLNENSSIMYPSKFKDRDVILHGEAQFDVEHQPRHPFRVTTHTTTTTVVGTVFNISSGEKNEPVAVSLIEGKVTFASSEKDELLVLEPGETATYDPVYQALAKTQTATPNFNAWQTGELAFEETAVETVIADLEDFFDYDIELANETSGECNFTGTFKEPSFDEILEVMSFTYDMDYVQRQGIYYLTIAECN